MELNRSKDVVIAFLSCSVRPRDWPLVDAMVKDVLAPMGFRCFTVGRNISLAEQTDDAIRKLMNSCECLIGVATERLQATDRDFPEQTLRLATPMLLQETSMAFQSELPFLMIKTEGIALQGVSNRNLWLEIEREMPAGKVRFRSKKDVVYSALRDLKQKALDRRAKMSRDHLKSTLGWICSIAVGGYGISRGVDRLLRPNCFGTFYYRDPECKRCDYRDRCKVEKLQRSVA
jgi:hypothetical protein